MHWRGFQFAAGRARMRAHAQKAQREKARIWGRAKRRTVENKKARPFFCMHACLRRGRAKGKRLALFSLQSVNKSVNRGDRKKPAERWFHGLFDGADDGNRTHTASLGSWSSTTKLHLHKLRTLLSIQHGAKKVKCFCAQTGVYCSCFSFCSGRL